LKSPLTSTYSERIQITAGTALAEAGVDLAVIQTLLGHAHVDSSVGYIHLAPTRVRAAYDQARAVQRART
jgi:site-specific recombinase XerD